MVLNEDNLKEQILPARVSACSPHSPTHQIRPLETIDSWLYSGDHGREVHGWLCEDMARQAAETGRSMSRSSIYMGVPEGWRVVVVLCQWNFCP